MAGILLNFLYYYNKGLLVYEKGAYCIVFLLQEGGLFKDDVYVYIILRLIVVASSIQEGGLL